MDAEFWFGCLCGGIGMATLMTVWVIVVSYRHPVEDFYGENVND